MVTAKGGVVCDCVSIMLVLLGVRRWRVACVDFFDPFEQVADAAHAPSANPSGLDATAGQLAGNRPQSRVAGGPNIRRNGREVLSEPFSIGGDSRTQAGAVTRQGPTGEVQMLFYSVTGPRVTISSCDPFSSGKVTPPFPTGSAAPSSSAAITPYPEPSGLRMVILIRARPSVTVAESFGQAFGKQGFNRRFAPARFRPSSPSTPARYIHPADPVYHVQPPRPSCGAVE